MKAECIQAVCMVLLVATGGTQEPANIVRTRPPITLLKITPDKIDFGSQPVGTSSKPKTATLLNISQSTVAIRDVTASGIDFTETDNCQGSLAPGMNCTIEVTFKPAITGPRMGTVIITDSDPASPRFLVLTGTGE